MKGMTLENIAKACGGEYFGSENLKSETVKGIVIDSRKVEEGVLFVPIKGNRVDGHDFIPQVFSMGALCVLSEKKLENEERPYILVESTTKALKSIAGFYRSELGIKVVGISGSVGKTSTKEMIASVLGTKYNVLKTEGNFNNEIGLPLTIFRLTEEHEIAVLEMGISNFGEMTRLAKVAKPDVCVLTNIGYCHLEDLKDRDGVLKAKTEMFEYINDNGKIVLNGDDDKLSTVKNVGNITPVFYGKNTTNNVYADNIENLGIEGTKCDIHFKDSKIGVNIGIPGEHMVLNALAAATVGKCMGLSDDEIKTGIDNATTIGGRCNIIRENEITIIDDCYNANPVSVKAGIDLLSTASSRKIAILGDMFELGENENELHYDVGKYAAEKGLDFLICIGEHSRYIHKGAADAGTECRVSYRQDKEGIDKVLKRFIHKGDTILVKASHAMGFEEIVSILKQLEL